MLNWCARSLTFLLFEACLLALMGSWSWMFLLIHSTEVSNNWQYGLIHKSVLLDKVSKWHAVANDCLMSVFTHPRFSDVFTLLVGLFFCLLTRLLKVVDECWWNFLRVFGLGKRNSWLDFECYLCSDQDPRILFFISNLPICNMWNSATLLWVH